jgi:predicted transglutaminase-like cysteine proteinase
MTQFVSVMTGSARPTDRGNVGSAGNLPPAMGGLVLAAAVWLGPGAAANGVQSAATPPQLIEQAVSLTPRRPPLAHVRFCHFHAQHCEFQLDRRRPGRSEAELMDEVRQVNRSVNRAIRPRPDPADDIWEINVAAGDCEDYALQKRAELLALGWPSEALRVAVVRMRNGVAHAVLLVTVGETDFVLDNMTAQIVRWNETPYRYLMIQDRANPRVWHDIAPVPRRMRTV